MKYINIEQSHKYNYLKYNKNIMQSERILRIKISITCSINKIKYRVESQII